MLRHGGSKSGNSARISWEDMMYADGLTGKNAGEVDAWYAAARKYIVDSRLGWTRSLSYSSCKRANGCAHHPSYAGHVHV